MQPFSQISPTKRHSATRKALIARRRGVFGTLDVGPQVHDPVQPWPPGENLHP